MDPKNANVAPSGSELEDILSDVLVKWASMHQNLHGGPQTHQRLCRHRREPNRQYSGDIGNGHVTTTLHELEEDRNEIIWGILRRALKA